MPRNSRNTPVQLKNQGDSARVTARVPMGTAVDLIQGGKEWSHIRLQDGTQGWVRSRFLGSSPIIPIANVDYTTVYNKRLRGFTEDVEGAYGSFTFLERT